MKDEAHAPLMHHEDTEAFRNRWMAIQTGFVDEPRRAVKEADALVAETMKRLSDMFTSERSKLEMQWSREEPVSTENLRLVLQRYRSFFDRLLGMTPMERERPRQEPQRDTERERVREPEPARERERAPERER
jgi:hypothetical protein